MAIGYACLALAVPGTTIKKCLLKNADEQRLRDLISHNLDALERMIDYNLSSGIKLYRISSDIVPFASSPINTVPWQEEYRERLKAIGIKIKGSGMRVSMHPGQYTVLNSPDDTIACNAMRELSYHAQFLDGLEVGPSHKIILHIGGVYGDKSAAMDRFVSRYHELSEGVRRRLVIENDDRCFTIEDVLSMSRKTDIPVVFDNLHNETNPSRKQAAASDWIRACARTWSAEDGRQKIHYSQSGSMKNPRAHSNTIAIQPFLSFLETLGTNPPDIMLEVKDKNISARKCVLCTALDIPFGEIEKEWARYKYLVLEHSQNDYKEIRTLLKDKSSNPAVPFFQMVERALSAAPQTGSAINAADHVWGYFKGVATAAEKRRYENARTAFANGSSSVASVKRILYRLAETYQQTYLLESYYFAYGISAKDELKQDQPVRKPSTTIHHGK